jgi:hypothetical protein
MSSDARTFGLEIGPYWIQLPAHAEIAANVIKRSETSYQIAWTDWIISLERFQFFVHLDPRLKLSDLKRLIEQTKKGDANIPTIGVNGIVGITHGDYGPPRTWIDWWFKRGDVMLCLCLQSKTFPFTAPSPEEKAEHCAIIDSIRYAPEVLGEEMALHRGGTSS